MGSNTVAPWHNRRLRTHCEICQERLSSPVPMQRYCFACSEKVKKAGGIKRYLKKARANIGN